MRVSARRDEWTGAPDVGADVPENCELIRFAMHENVPARSAGVIGPLGRELTIGDLPSSDRVRWVLRRKAEVVAAVNGGLLSVDEACGRYSLTLEELQAWKDAVDCSGLMGLRVKRRGVLDQE